MQRKTTNSVSPATDTKKAHKNPEWGRAKGSFPASLLFGAMILFCPILPLWFYISCNSYDCAVIEPGIKIFKGELTVAEVFSHAPAFSWEAIQIGLGWLAYQLVLAVFLPGPTGYGQLTPAGNVLAYKVNGLNVWILTHILFGVFGFWLRWFEPTVIYDNWGGLLIFANIWGFALTLFAFVKAYTFPTHPADRKFSGYLLYDLFWGIEFNPRIGPLDFKLFMNGRPGICAWTLINLSFAAAQFRNYGYVTNSMLIVNLLHAIYVVDFFYNEDWYLRTIDIAHDHFGFMLAWGDSVWLPFTYTVQGFYLVTHPVQLSPMATSAILALGFIGYYIFRAVNHQKDHFRSTDGKCTIWGKPAEFIDAKFSTSDGKQRSSKLLVSGWWGVSRHFNYVGDLCISLAYCLPCGFTHILPYFYIIYMTCLLVERTRRDDGRLTRKYGPYWAEYKKRVPWAIFPYIW